MCLIIKKPAGRAIPSDFLEAIWRRNHDGWGCAYFSQGQLRIERSLSFEELMHWNSSFPLEVEAYVHLRQATAGGVTEAMAHPHLVCPGVALMHNGTIRDLVPAEGTNSDSWELARLLGTILQLLSHEDRARLIRTEGFVRLLTALITSSRVVLLDSVGPVLFGQGWHEVTAPEWSEEMAGILVSNVTAWTPKNAENRVKSRRNRKKS